jgi:hypothetical protein
MIDRLPMRAALALAVLCAGALATAGCVPTQLDYLREPMVSVTLNCDDGYMLYNRKETNSILVTPYIVSEAYYRTCGKGTTPLPVRARMAAEKHLGPKCRILSEAEPMSLNFEFTYVCEKPQPDVPVVR